MTRNESRAASAILTAGMLAAFSLGWACGVCWVWLGV